MLNRKVSSLTLFIVLFVILFGGIQIAKAVGLWTSEAEKNIVKYDDIDAYNPESISGSLSIAEVSEYYDVPTEDLLKSFKFDSTVDPNKIFGKDFELYYEQYSNESEEIEIGNGSIKQFVAFYKDLPYPLDETAYFPNTALDVLLEKRSLSDETLDYMKQHIIQMDDFLITNETMMAINESNETIEEEVPLIKGSTTFKVVIDAGVSVEAIETVLGVPLPRENLVIKDFCIENDLSFSDIKNKLEALIEQ